MSKASVLADEFVAAPGHPLGRLGVVGSVSSAPRWQQVSELPRSPMQVTEHQTHARTCPDCGHLTWALFPEEVRAHVCGPRLTAILSYLAGVPHASKRRIEEFVPRLDLFGAAADSFQLFGDAFHGSILALSLRGRRLSISRWF